MATTKTTDVPVILKVSIPQSVKRRLRIHAATIGKPMTEVVADIIEKQLKEVKANG